MAQENLDGPPWDVTSFLNRTQNLQPPCFVPMNSPFTAKNIYEFDAHGFTVFREFLDPELVARANTLIDKYHHSSEVGFRKFPFLHIDPVFLEIMADDRAVQICRHWLGPWYRLDNAFGVQAGPFDNESNCQQEDLHAGPYAEEGVFRYGWHNNRSQCGLLAFVYCLEQVKSGDGGLVLVPGSHKANLALSGQEIFSDLLGRQHSEWWIINPSLSPGDLLVFSEATVHGSKRWSSNGRRRRNLHYSYSPGYQAQACFSSVEELTKLARTSRQRDILRPPYVMRIDMSDKSVGDNQWRSPVR